MTCEELDLDAIRRSLAMNGDAGWSAYIVRALVEEVERLREERAASPAVVVTQGRGFTDMMLRCERLENEVMELHAEVERLLEQAESTNFQREQERAAVVAWLREEYDTHSTQDAAEHIERGEHRREGEP